MPRHRNENLRKRCECPWQLWPKCPHSWGLNFKPRGGRLYRFSLDAELGRHLATKDEARIEVARIKAEILAGTFKLAVDVRAPQARRAPHPTQPTAVSEELTPLDDFAPNYLERVRASGKTSWGNDG